MSKPSVITPIKFFATNVENGLHVITMQRPNDPRLMTGDAAHVIDKRGYKKYFRVAFVDGTDNGRIELRPFTYCRGCPPYEMAERTEITIQNPGYYIVYPEGESKPNPDYSPKPPVGLIPRWRWNELRKEAIFEAINRYEEAGKEIPAEWVEELKDMGVKCSML